MVTMALVRVASQGLVRRKWGKVKLLKQQTISNLTGVMLTSRKGRNLIAWKWHY